MGKRIQAFFLAGLTALGLSVSAVPVRAEDSAPVVGGAIAGFAFTRLMNDAFLYLDRGICKVLGYGASAAANAGGTGNQAIAEVLTWAQRIVGSPASVKMKQITQTIQMLSRQLTELQNNMSSDFAHVNAQIAELEQEQKNNLFIEKYNSLSKYTVRYEGLAQIYSGLVSASSAYNDNPTEENKQNLKEAYKNVEDLYIAASSNNPNYHNQIEFNFDGDLQEICSLLSSYNYNQGVDLEQDPGNSAYWGADSHTITVLGSYYDYIQTQDAFESEAYEDMKTVINVCAGSAAWYIQAYQLYLTYEAQRIYSTPAQELGIPDIAEEADKADYVQGLWDTYAERYYKVQRALCQMIASYKSEMDGWMRDYDTDSYIWFSPLNSTYRVPYTDSHEDTASVITAGKENTHVNLFRPLGGNMSYALRVPVSDSDTPEMKVSDSYYVRYKRILKDWMARSADYENLMTAKSYSSSAKSFETGYTLIQYPTDLASITNTKAYDLAGGNLIGFLRSHSVDADADIPFDNTRTLKSGYFLITSNITEDYRHGDDENFGWINISKILDKSNLSGNVADMDCDDDLSQKSSIYDQNLTILYKADTPKAMVSLNGDSHVEASLVSDDSSRTPLASGQVYDSGSHVAVRFRPENGYYVSSLKLVGNRDSNEATKEVLYDFLTGWSRGGETEHKEASKEEILDFFNSLEVDEEGYYSFVLPVGYGDSEVEIQTSQLEAADISYTASIQGSTQGAALFSGMTGALSQQYHAGDTVELSVIPYSGNICRGLTVTQTAADGTVTGIEVTDATADAGALQVSKNEKLFRFTMPAGDVTISADYVDGNRVIFGENGKKTSTNDLLFFAGLGPEGSGASQDNNASEMTYQQGDTVVIGTNLENQHILSRLDILNTETNDVIPAKAVMVQVSDGTTAEEVPGYSFTMPGADVSVVAEDTVISGHTVTLDAAEGGSLCFIDADGKAINRNILNPQRGETVRFKVEADGDYVLNGKPAANQTNDDPLSLKDEGDGIYSFTMGNANVTVEAGFSLAVSAGVTLNFGAGGTAGLQSVDKTGAASLLTSENGSTVQVPAGSQVQIYASLNAETYSGNITFTVTDQNEHIIYTKTCLDPADPGAPSTAVFTVPPTDCTVQVSFAPEEQSVYYIPDYDTLKHVIEEMNSDDEDSANHFLGASYVVTDDFSADNAADVLSWKYPDREFTGTFDGNGHTITNLSMGSALIPTIGEGGTLKNLTLKEFSNTDESKGGSFFQINLGTVDGCVLAGASEVRVCGLGYENQGMIRNCGVNASVKIIGTDELAGFVFVNNVDDAPDARIYNSYTAAALYLTYAWYNGVPMVACFTDNRNTGESCSLVNCYCMASLNFEYGEDAQARLFIFQQQISDPACTKYCYYKDSLPKGIAEEQVLAQSQPSDLQKISVDEQTFREDSIPVALNKSAMDALPEEPLLQWGADIQAENAGFPVLEKTAPAARIFSITKETVHAGSIEVTDAEGTPVAEAAEGETVQINLKEGTLTSLKYYNAETGEEAGDLTEKIGAVAGDSTEFIMPDYPVHFVAVFKEGQETERYPISRSHYNPGTVYVRNEQGQELSSSFGGRTVYVTGEPGNGYMLDTVEVLDNSGQVLFSGEPDGGMVQTEAGYAFTMPYQAVTVHVKFRKFVPTLTTEVVGNGSLTVSGQSMSDGQFAAGTGLQVSVAADSGNVPVRLALYREDGTVVQTLIASYQDYYAKQTDGRFTATLIMPDENVKLRAEFLSVEGLSYHAVTARSVGEGSVSLSVESGGGIPSAVIAGKKVTVQASAGDAEGQYIRTVELQTADGTRIGEPLLESDKNTGSGTAELTFEMPDQDVVVYVVFADRTEPDRKDGVYQISTYEDLVSMARNIRDYPEVYADADYELTGDVDCSADGVNQVWTLPIGTADHPFNGTFEGKDYSIEHLTIQLERKESSDGTAGLFGVIGENGVVQHLSVLNLTWDAATEYAGGIAGVNLGTINYCSSGINIGGTGDESGYIDMDTPFAMLQTTVSGTDTAGGITAVNRGKILNSRSNALVTGAETAGGIAGSNYGTIYNFYNLGHVFGTKTEGGIVGRNYGTIQNGYNGFVLETGVSGEQTGQIAGGAESFEIKDVYYSAKGNAVGGADGEEVSNEELPSAQYKAPEEMCSQAFADLLNENIADDTDENLGIWEYNAAKNYGYPRIQAAVLTQKTWTGKNGVTVSGYIHPDAALEVRELDKNAENSKDAADYQALQAGAEGGELLSAYDISMRFANGRRATFEGELVITIPAGQVEKLQNLKVLHYYNGKIATEAVEKLQDGSVQITVRHLSPFGVVRTNDSAEPQNPESKETTAGKGGKALPTGTGNENTGTIKTAGVRTGDTAPLALMLAVWTAAAAGLAVLAVLYKRRKGKNRGRQD